MIETYFNEFVLCDSRLGRDIIKDLAIKNLETKDFIEFSHMCIKHICEEMRNILI
jgi:hypothetical protein